MSAAEVVMAGAIAVTIFLWICGTWLGINSVAAALVGLSVLLLFNVVTWKECLADGVQRERRLLMNSKCGMHPYCAAFPTQLTLQ